MNYKLKFSLFCYLVCHPKLTFILKHPLNIMISLYLCLPTGFEVI
jgi:hypothetical protein